MKMVVLCLVMIFSTQVFAQEGKIAVGQDNKDMKILSYTYEKGGKKYTAKIAKEKEIKKAGITPLTCTCGQEYCALYNGRLWVWRCMASGGGVCNWYVTYEVCNTPGPLNQ